jgi:hypothetical protein
MFYPARWRPLTTLSVSWRIISALPLAALGLSMSAGADGRRLTLGANRPLHDMAPVFPMPYAQLSAGPSLPHGRPVEAPMASGLMPIPKTGNAEGPPVRVLPFARQASTPEIKADPVQARATVVRHATASGEKAARHVQVAVPRAKVTVRETPKREARVRVDAPSTRVTVRDDRVRVDAPHTRVAVDDGRVRVRAPFVNLDIRW